MRGKVPLILVVVATAAAVMIAPPAMSDISLRAAAPNGLYSCSASSVSYYCTKIDECYLDVQCRTSLFYPGTLFKDGFECPQNGEDCK